MPPHLERGARNRRNVEGERRSEGVQREQRM